MLIRMNTVITYLLLSGEQWSEESIDKFEDLTYACKWKVVMAKAESYSEEIPHLTLVDTNTETVSSSFYLYKFFVNGKLLCQSLELLRGNTPPNP